MACPRRKWAIVSVAPSPATKEDRMPTLGLSQKSFKIGQNTFKVYGDSLGSSNVSNLTTSASKYTWQNPQTVGHSQNHVEIKATLASTAATSEKPKDTIGDLTVTVTDNTGQSATTTFTPVTYTP